MEPDLLGLGIGAVVAFLLIDKVFAFIKPLLAKRTDEPSSITCDNCPIRSKDVVQLETMGIQVGEIHRSMMISRELEKAISKQTNILEAMLQILQLMTEPDK